ncbi:MAG: spinster family MFS transporter [Rhodospirillaceae bacterium]
MSHQIADKTIEYNGYPRTGYAWYVVVLLFGTYTLSYIDRYILSLLIEPVKATLQLTDFQIGVLLGPAFVLFFVVMGLPFGWLADRKNRRVIITFAIIFWSILTAACGLARTFVTLLIARIGVGVGEAGLSPSSLSLICDYFPKETRPRALAFWITGNTVGAGLTYILGGQLVEIVRDMPPIILPVFGELLGWQTAFLAVGIPGILVAAIFYLTVREPPRQERLKTVSGADAAPTVGEALQYVKKRWQSYGAIYLGAIGISGLGSASMWSPALFERTWGWGLGQSGLAMGVALVTAGLLGANFGGWLAAWLVRRGIHHGAYITMFVGCAIAFPFFALFPLMPTPELGVVMLFIMYLGMSMNAGTIPSAIVAISPSELRGQATALLWLFTNLLGAMFGPPMVGLITDLFGDPSALKYGIALTAVFYGIIMNVAMFWGYKHFRQSAEDLAKLT